jgi:hypothetical protein
MLGTARPKIHLGLAALAAAGLLTAACGGDDGGGDGVASLDEGDSGGESAQGDEAAAEEELLDWVQCMRDEGVEISDPTRDEDGNLVISGPGIQIGGGGNAALGEGPPGRGDSGDGGDEPPLNREEMDAAMEACGHPPPLGGGFSEEERQEMEESALAFAECMREEGIEDFPDPDFSDMGPGGAPGRAESDSHASDDEGGDGERLVLGPFGEIDLDDPEIAAAFEQCQDLMARPGGPGGPDGGVGPDQGAGG